MHRINRTHFIRANTELSAPPLVPEIELHLASDAVELWGRTEEELEAQGVPPPYWAFAWAGGQALARYLLDHPQEVAGKTALDFGSGSGLVAIAAAMAGARSVLAADIDAFAAAAIALNCAANFPPPLAGEVAREHFASATEGGRVCQLPPFACSPLSRGRHFPRTRGKKKDGKRGRKDGVEIVADDIVGSPCRWDVILLGDMCYERPLAERLLGWLNCCARGGAQVFLGDPGRSYFPKSGVTQLATYRVQTPRTLEDRDVRETSVYRLTGG